MNDDVGNLILERLRRMDDHLINIEGDMSDAKTRLTALEEHLSGLFIALTGVNSRLDRFVDRVDRIERRLDLSDHR